MNTLSWIIGKGGLLGSSYTRAIERESQATVFQSSTPRFSWTNARLLHTELAAASKKFADEVGNQKASWGVYWAIGRCNMSSTPEELKSETNILRELLELLHAHASLRERPGTIVFASSAGAVYAGSPNEIITEETVPAPLSDYGKEKLKQEAILRDWAAGHLNVSVLIARFSTLYGPDQSKTKRQGLLTHITRCILKNEPIGIFVPIDTIRDYMHVNDATQYCMNVLKHVRGSGQVLTKIIASEESTTIAHILEIFTDITGTPPNVVMSTDPLGNLYPHHIRFRSNVLRNAAPAEKTSLSAGIAELFAHERTTFLR